VRAAEGRRPVAARTRSGGQEARSGAGATTPPAPGATATVPRLRVHPARRPQCLFVGRLRRSPHGSGGATGGQSVEGAALRPPPSRLSYLAFGGRPGPPRRGVGSGVPHAAADAQPCPLRALLSSGRGARETTTCLPSRVRADRSRCGEGSERGTSHVWSSGVAGVRHPRRRGPPYPTYDRIYLLTLLPSPAFVNAKARRVGSTLRRLRPHLSTVAPDVPWVRSRGGRPASHLAPCVA